jgi:hypothetical protein
MTTKKKLGQFFTTNYKYILQNLYIPDNVNSIIEPFAGNCDLLQFILDNENNENYNIQLFDIQPKKDNVIYRDTLTNPPNYKNSFIITNPPYLARNKSNNKQIFDLYNQNDLYKCFIYNLLTNKCSGGIIIIPLNFWCSIRKADIILRQKFLSIYKIILLNIFEENVFDDTSYSVCSFQFELINYNENNNENKDITMCIYPSNKIYNMTLGNDNNFTFGGHIYKLNQNNNIHIYRLTKLNKINDNDFITNINVICIDNNSNSKIRMEYVEDNERFIDETDKLSARTFCCLIIKPKINNDIQKKLVEYFNTYLNDNRDKYNSLFLCNYRESKDIARKRISFDLVYSVSNYLLNSLI